MKRKTLIKIIGLPSDATTKAINARSCYLNRTKTFFDLIFKQHHISVSMKEIGFKTHAKMYFKNGFGVSVITGESAYTYAEGKYEIAILFNRNITYDSGLTDDVIGYQTANDINNIMQEVQLLKRM